MGLKTDQELARLASAYAKQGELRKQMGSNYAGQQAAAQYGQDTQWGNSAMQGAQMGSQFGPWGGLIGGIGGSLAGQFKGMQARRKKGQGFWEALGNTLIDIPGSLPDFSSGAPAAATMGQMYQNQMAKNQPNLPIGASQEGAVQEAMSGSSQFDDDERRKRTVPDYTGNTQAPV